MVFKINWLKQLKEWRMEGPKQTKNSEQVSTFKFNKLKSQTVKSELKKSLSETACYTSLRHILSITPHNFRSKKLIAAYLVWF